MLLDILMFVLTISYCTGFNKWRRTIISCWIYQCSLGQHHIVQVGVTEGQYYPAGYLSVSCDNIILYMYALMEKDNNIMLDILVFLLTISYCTGMYKWRMTMLLDILLFLLTISYCAGIHFGYQIVILYFHLICTMFLYCICIYVHCCRMMKVSFQ